MYDLSNYQRAKLLAALPPAACDVNPSELMDRMLALLPPKEQAKPYIMFTHAFLTRLPAHTCQLPRLDCWWSLPGADVQFFARLAANVFVTTMPQDKPAATVDSSVNAVSGNSYCYCYCFYHQKWGIKVCSCSGNALSRETGAPTTKLANLVSCPAVSSPSSSSLLSLSSSPSPSSMLSLLSSSSQSSLPSPSHPPSSQPSDSLLYICDMLSCLPLLWP